MAYEHDDPRAADLGSGTPRSNDRGADHGTDLPADGPSAIGGHGPDASASRLDDDLASVLMGGGLLPPVLADGDRDLGFPPPQAPDLATAFLAALDAVDDRRFVTPPPADPQPRPTPERVYDAPRRDTAAESTPEPIGEPVREGASSPAPPAITHASDFDRMQHDEPVEAPRETPIAGLLTMGDRDEPAKLALVRVFDAPSVDLFAPLAAPTFEPPAAAVESATPFRDEALDRDPFDRESVGHEPFARDSFDHDLFDHEWLDDPSDAAAARALDESASGDRVDEEPEPMTVAEWAATFATVEPMASVPGVFEDGAPIDRTVELRPSDDDGLAPSDAIQDVIPFDEPQPAAASVSAAAPPAFNVRVPISGFGEPVPSEFEPEPTPLALDTLGGFDEPVRLAASPFEPSPFASDDDVPFGVVPAERTSTTFDREPVSPVDEMPFDELSALEPTALEPTVLDDSATFDEPASIDMPVPIEAAEPEAVDAEPEPDVLPDLQEYVVFSLGDLRCVVPIRNVIEVGRIPDAAPVPNAPAWLHGLGNLRGQVLTLIDLRQFFGVGRIKQSTGRMVVLRADADDVTAAVMVDQVHQIVSLSPSRFRQAPATLPERSTQFVWGACDYGNYTMIGLDVDGVLGVEATTEAAAEATV